MKNMITIGLRIVFALNAHFNQHLMIIHVSIKVAYTTTCLNISKNVKKERGGCKGMFWSLFIVFIEMVFDKTDGIVLWIPQLTQINMKQRQQKVG